MQGTLRTLIGFLIAFGAVGTLDFDPTASVLVQGALALAGLALMASGVSAINARR